MPDDFTVEYDKDKTISQIDDLVELMLVAKD